MSNPNGNLASESFPVGGNEIVHLVRDRRYEEALARFRRAWEASRSPEALAQMALASQALGRWVDAEHHLVAALASDTHPWIARNRAHLDEALEEIRRHLGTLEVRARTPGARVRIDAGEATPLPLASPLRLVVGTAHVEVSADGYVTVRRALEVRPGDDLLETFELTPAPRDPAPTTPPPLVRSTVVDAPPSHAQVWGVRLLVGGGALLVVGGGALVWREVAAGEFNATREPPCAVVPSMPGVVDGGALCGSLRTQTDVATVVSAAGFVAGGAAALTGVSPNATISAAITTAP